MTKKGTIVIVFLAGASFIFVIALLIFGYVFFQNQQLARKSPEKQAESSTNTSPLKTITWKTYTNEKFGYSIDYPDTWTTSRLDGGSTENSSYINFRKTDDPIPAASGFSVVVIENNSLNLPLSQWVKQSLPHGYLLSPSGLKTTPITVNGITWEKVLDASLGIVPSGHVAFGAPHNGKLYLFLSHVATDEEIFVFVGRLKFLPTVNKSAIPGAVKKILPYYLPSGWKTVQSRDGRFEIGYNPATESVSSEDGGNGLSFYGIWSTGSGQIRNLGYRYSFSIKPYDNGSRHNFLYRLLSFKPFGTNYDDLPENNYEREYSVQGWPCLVLFRIEISQWPQTWGVCPISKSEAISFSMDGDESVVEQILQTVRLLK